MNILVTGRGTSGSWKIRGEQLGTAIGATVAPNHDGHGFDLAIVVKRPRLRPVVPFVWDVVDAWPQPEGNEWEHDACMTWLRSEVARLQPHGIVAATQAMARDCAEFGIPMLCLPHHARPGQATNPIRESVHTVGYEGGEQYIVRWRPVIEAECKRRGWRFVVNPQHLADVDIVVALRDQTGYAARHWKSNLKLANAQGSGTPCVVNREAGYLETGAEMFADFPGELAVAFDSLTDYQVRRKMSVRLIAKTPVLKATAFSYLIWLQALRF